MAVDWSRITSGPTFHAMVGVILYQRDSEVHIFNRDGKDGAIDALSGDRKTVYQSKYHQDRTASHLFSDAKREAKKIQKYRVPGHRWEPMWQAAREWRLMTNVVIGPQDLQRWKDEIVPLFDGIGLSAEYDASARLEADLVKYPHIADAYVGGRPRAFVSLAERRETLVAREILARAYDVPLHGRDVELAEYRAFVTQSATRVLLLSGPGGVGKSRLQYEGARIAQEDALVQDVYCATPQLAVSPDWYSGLVERANALVLLEDPPEPEFVKRILHELMHRQAGWKVVITVRSHHDPVLACLRSPRGLGVETIEVRPLPKDDAERLADALLAPLKITAEHLRRARRWILHASDGIPIWMTIAVKLLEDRGSAGAPGSVAQEYLKEIIAHSEPTIATAAQVLTLLRWLALLQPINREGSELLTALAERVAGPVDRLLVDLSNRGVVTCYGVDKRLAEIRPDVFREHILLDWLTIPDPSGGRRPSPEAREIADRLAASAGSGDATQQIRRTLDALARMERTIDQPMLDPIAESVVQLATAAADTLQQQRAFGLAALVAFVRPGVTAKVARLLRTMVVAEATRPLHSWPIRHSDIVADLPHALYRAAHGANTPSDRREIIEELIALADAEPESTANTGTTARDYLPRVVQERHGYLTSFKREATSIGSALLDDLERGVIPSAGGQLLLRSISALEHRDTYLSPDDPNKFVWERILIAPDGAWGRFVRDSRERAWKLAMSSGHLAGSRHFAWDMLRQIHDQACRHREVPEWHDVVSDDLQRCRVFVTLVTSVTELAELQAARAVWDWHHEHEQEPLLREIANECEAAYLAHPQVDPFVRVFGASRFVDVDAMIQAQADDWPPDSTSEELAEFLEGALRFASTHTESWRRSRVLAFAWQLGYTQGRTPAVSTTVFEWLHEGLSTDQFPLALRLLAGHAHHVRQAQPEDLAPLFDLVDECLPDDRSRRVLLSEFVVHASPGLVRAWVEADWAFAMRHWSRLVEFSLAERFQLIGRRLYFEPSSMTEVERALTALGGGGEYPAALFALWTGLHDMGYSDSWIGREQTIDRLVELSLLDPEFLDGASGDWNLGQILKARQPAMGLGWFVDIMQQRATQRLSPHFPSDPKFVVAVVGTLADAEPTDVDRESMTELLEGMPGTASPALLAALDPHGRIVPAFAAGRLGPAVQPNHAWPWARVAACYPHSSVPWRTIVRATCSAARDWRENDRHGLFHAVDQRLSRAWIGTPGELHPRFQKAVDRAHEGLDGETDAELRPYWEWRLAQAQDALVRANGDIEEGD